MFADEFFVEDFGELDHFGGITESTKFREAIKRSDGGRDGCVQCGDARGRGCPKFCEWRGRAGVLPMRSSMRRDTQVRLSLSRNFRGITYPSCEIATSSCIRTLQRIPHSTNAVSWPLQRGAARTEYRCLSSRLNLGKWDYEMI